MKTSYKFQRQEASTAEHCCVPFCSTSAKYNSAVSFHTFPSNEQLRKRWIVNIRREDVFISNHTRVCSRHFTAQAIKEPREKGGRRRLTLGAVPVLFHWNDYSLGERTATPEMETGEVVRVRNHCVSPDPAVVDNVLEEKQTQPQRPSVSDRVNRPELMECSPTVDHDYCSVPELVCLNMAIDKNTKLKEEIEALRKNIEELKSQSTFGLQRFAGSDDDIRFYTRFTSYRHFMMFWRLIEPSIHKMILSSRAAERSEAVTDVRATRTRLFLQPIDELFLFQMYLAAGLKERDLANRFKVHPSTVSRIISSWTHYLYTLLGALCIWIDAEDIRAHLPDYFKDFPDTQVIVDCTELKCQTPASPLLQSEMFSKYKSHCTMKGLIGMAPHGAVTFVSSLYEGCISNKQLFLRSGLADLLTEDMAIMVNKGFRISDCVKCKVYCPPFPFKQSQTPAHSDLQTQKNARLRVHVECLIQRIKENKLFDSVIPLSVVGSINELFSVACLLINYQYKPLVGVK